jgi:4-hydroxy-tetrahydrodipicolinate reductase
MYYGKHQFYGVVYMIRVVVNGAMGKMGQETVAAVKAAPSCELVGQCDKDDDLASVIRTSNADVVVDFTHPAVVMKNVACILNENTHAVVGTTGLSDADFQTLTRLAKDKGKACLIMPNFAIGAVLMMQFAAQAAKYLNRAEIIELHHDKKADAPSGTAIKTAQWMREANPEINTESLDETELITGARGGLCEGIPTHSVRLPGYVASQEVILGGTGQRLSLRHDSISRDCFMPGVILCVEKAETFSVNTSI